MKKLLLLVTTSIFLLSCNNDDEPSTSNVAAEGTWKLTAFTTDEATDINNDGIETTNFIAETNCYNNSTITLSSGNIATALFQELDIELNLEVGTTNQYSYTVDCLGGTPTAGTWSQNNNAITVNIEDEPLTFTLNENELTVVIPEFVQVESYNGTEIVTTFTGAKLVFTKQ